MPIEQPLKLIVERDLRSVFPWPKRKATFRRSDRAAILRDGRAHLLALESVAQLSGRAWNITQDLDHSALVHCNGTIYLLEFLRDRLGKTPVPDVGLRLEELVIRLKRPAGMSKATWSSNVRQLCRKDRRRTPAMRRSSLLTSTRTLTREGLETATQGQRQRLFTKALEDLCLWDAYGLSPQRAVQEFK